MKLILRAKVENNEKINHECFLTMSLHKELKNG